MRKSEHTPAGGEGGGDRWNAPFNEEKERQQCSRVRKERAIEATEDAEETRAQRKRSKDWNLKNTVTRGIIEKDRKIMNMKSPISCPHARALVSSLSTR